MLSLEHFSHVSWCSSSAYFWLVWQELGKGLWGLIEGHLVACLHDDKFPAKSGSPAPETELPVTHSSPVEHLGFPTAHTAPALQSRGRALTVTRLRPQPLPRESTNPAGCWFSLTGVYSLLFSCLENTRRAAAFAPGGKHLCKCEQNTWWMSRCKESWAMRKKGTASERCSHLRNLEKWTT